MKKYNLLAIGLSLGLMTITGCDKLSPGVKLDTDEQKASYAIGQQLGQNLKSQNIDFDAQVLAASLADAAKGESKMKKEEIQQAIMKLQEIVMKKQQAKAEENTKVANDFLEKNKSQAGVKVTASGLQYIVEKEGDGPTPTKDDMVQCHYTGTLIDGKKFDSSVDRGQPADFPVSGVIPGWTEALQMMKVGSKYKLFVPPNLGYGPRGTPEIPPNSVLVFEVELLKILPKEKSPAHPGMKAPEAGTKAGKKKK